ncbi:structural maintenance of chromosomes protein 2-like [Homarus americanus]|uniref:Structural maintenance of chromosomes protein 2-like n=1 Tax=Homarus americanus TaxID=6706 RepID=A0A8J5TJ37_HOMAM|nr:structural maintenance of chromosomes protein 2-like [Homarus americanus]
MTKQAEMKLKHSKEELKKKEQEMKCTSAEYTKDKSFLDRMEKEVKNLETQLGKLDYDDSKVEELEGERRLLNNQIMNLQEKVEHLESRYPQLCFNYKDPEKNFNHSLVKGLVCKLVKLRDPTTATALEVTAGGKLYNVIVDSEVTGKKLLQNGQLQRRVTIIPLNKITGRSIDAHIVKQAENLVGKENVQTALSLVCYDHDLHKAMEWVFGSSFICHDMDVAKQVTFNKNIMRKSVTLDGDVFDPAGTLTGEMPDLPQDDEKGQNSLVIEENGESDRHTYCLISVISHFGLTTNTGHYVADVFNCEEDSWFHYDDECVVKIPETVVFAEGRQKNGYIFFYMHK